MKSSPETKRTNRHIKKVAVLGSGIMGSRIACHFANIGLQVVLLDIPGKEKPNAIVDKALADSLKAKPSPIYHKSFSNRIETGTFEHDFHKISDCDWILEAVIERLDIKQQIFEKVDALRSPNSIVSSNTSGIPIEMMLEARSESFCKNFVGTHFFNPPRYLRLFEIIPSSKTDPDLVDFLMDYGQRFLGKQTVLCKDTPAFIANRIGVFSIMAIFQLLGKHKLTIEEVDVLTGPLTGHPKSATFRTCDLVGLDTLVKVANGVRENCPHDEAKHLFEIPAFLQKLLDNNFLGDKTGQGFYKKTKDENGKSLIQALDLDSFEYVPKRKAKFASVAQAKTLDSLEQRLQFFAQQEDKASQFLNELSFHLFSYASFRIPEISEQIYAIDDAIKAGFGWDLGVFEHWDLIGLKPTLEKMKASGFAVAPWLDKMVENGEEHFYKVEGNQRLCYHPATESYANIPGMDGFIFLKNLEKSSALFSNSACTLQDLGDGILNLEFHTKMNAIGGEVLQGINQAIDIAEDRFAGLIIGNQAPNFSAGANLAMILMLAVEQEFDELDFAIRHFQNTLMRLRYSSIPTANTPHGLTLGGGCEMTMHTDLAVAAAETYIGLVEVGVGVIPGGGGTKEMVLRSSDQFSQDDPKLPTLQEKFIAIATAKVATSAYEALDIGVLSHKKDYISVNQDMLISEAKKRLVKMAEKGYSQPLQREDILVLGRTALGAMYAGAEAFHVGKYASDHDLKIAKKLAFVMAGGDLSQATRVSEQYLLDLEREAFLSLLGEQKTLERIQSILTTGKPLRN